MFIMPMGVLTFWFSGLLSLGLLGGGIYLGWAWYEGVVIGIGYFFAALAMILLALLGRPIMLLFLGSKGDPDPPDGRREGRVHQIPRPDGTVLYVEEYGPENAPTIVMTHGWGLDSTAWCFARRRLTKNFRLLVWDLPGLGLSHGPNNADYSLEKMAADLESVVNLAGNTPVLLMGHSIGGMITLTFCKLFPDYLGSRVAGLILENTTYINPVLTARGHGILRAIQKPILEPLIALQIILLPLAWLMTWLSYINGSTHLGLHLSQFGQHETTSQLEFAARYSLRASPAVLARGMFGMLRYDASEMLSKISVPVLVLTGDRDHLTLPEAGEHIAKTVRNGERQEFQPAGHLTLFEKHQTVNETVEGFALRSFSNQAMLVPDNETQESPVIPALKSA